MSGSLQLAFKFAMGSILVFGLILTSEHMNLVLELGVKKNFIGVSLIPNSWSIQGRYTLDIGITLVYVLHIKVIHKVILTLNLTFILTGPLILPF